MSDTLGKVVAEMRARADACTSLNAGIAIMLRQYATRVEELSRKYEAVGRCEPCVDAKGKYDAIVKEWSAEYRDHYARVSFCDFIANKVMRLEADRDNWRKQALAEDERANCNAERRTE